MESQKKDLLNKFIYTLPYGLKNHIFKFISWVSIPKLLLMNEEYWIIYYK